MSRREKIAVSLAGTCLVLFALLQLVVFPVSASRERLRKGIAAKKEQLVEMEAMLERYEQLGKRSRELAVVLEKRSPDFSLFSFLEANAAQSAVKERITYMKPSELSDEEMLRRSMVEMKLQAIGIEQLVEFLKRTESAENLVGIQRMVVEENSREKGTLDATLQIVSVDAVLQ